jgi:hypothetical protein
MGHRRGDEPVIDPTEDRADRAPNAERDYLLVRLGAAESGVEVGFDSSPTAGGGFDDGCGNGFWCPTCRVEIRAEALAWLHDLAEAHFGRFRP